MKNTAQNWKGLTKDMFNPQLFSETLFGSGNVYSDSLNEDYTDLGIEEMNYNDFVQLEVERKNKRMARKAAGAFN